MYIFLHLEEKITPANTPVCMSLSIFITFSCCAPHLQFLSLSSWFHSDINNIRVSQFIWG